MKKWAGAFLGILLFPFVLFAQETAGEDISEYHASGEGEAEVDAATERASMEIANHIDAVKSAQPGDYILLPSGNKYILTKEEIMIVGGAFDYEDLSGVATKTSDNGTEIKTISQAHEIHIYPDGKTVHVLKTSVAFASFLNYIEEKYHLTRYLDSSGILRDSKPLNAPNFDVFRVIIQFEKITNGSEELESLAVSAYNYEGKSFAVKYCSAPGMVWGMVSSEALYKTGKKTSVFSIITSGNGAVSVITDFDDREPLVIVQTIPSFNKSESTDNTYQSNSPIVFFFNDKIYLNSIEGNIDITVDGRHVDGTITINEGANGYAVLTLTPNTPLPVGGNISVSVKKNIQDDGGNPMQNEIGFSYKAKQGSDTNFENNLGFESGSNGIAFSGDGAILTARGDLVPHEGSYFTAISTGERIVSEYGAIGSSSSQILLGPIQQSFSSLTFSYNFISAEFNEYVGSRFDDNAMVTINGTRGTHTEIITSVNRVGHNNTKFSDYPGMPDAGDSYAGHTGWKTYRIENINVGYPAYIIFTVTDVGDNAFSSILAIDSLELK